MSRLTIYAEDDPTAVLLDTSDGETIARELEEIGVTFERWPAQVPLPDDADDATVLSAYAPEIDRLSAANGYRSVDVIRLTPSHPDRAVLRTKFLDEHVHAEDEVRFFVEGEGLFTLRDKGRVHAVLCEAGDLISVPAGIRHWFDMGPTPRFTAIRLFTSPEGWVARFSGDPIAARFPRHEPA
jgi:1,2-dihydroxy-3-keto-5-methylthiopentene dioxygenase